MTWQRRRQSPEDVARTADRLRSMCHAQLALNDADPVAVRARIERMTYGGSRQRNQDTETAR